MEKFLLKLTRKESQRTWVRGVGIWIAVKVSAQCHKGHTEKVFVETENSQCSRDLAALLLLLLPFPMPMLFLPFMSALEVTSSL